MKRLDWLAVGAWILVLCVAALVALGITVFVEWVA
jgi:hypothetical protein